MKKLTDRMRRWFAHRRRQEARKVAQRSVASGATATQPLKMNPAAEAKTDFLTQRAKLPKISFNYNVLAKHAAFQPPEDFSLTKDYYGTLAFIMDFQRIFYERKPHRSPSGKRIAHYADFGKIRKIDPGAGLVLAAEIDRFAKQNGRPTRVYHHLWQEPVRDYFAQAGLFELLKIDPSVISVAGSGGLKRETLKFVSGNSLSGSAAQSLLTKLEDLTLRKLNDRPAAYNAIAEALANINHAYPETFVSWPYLTSGQWWASGFWQPSGNRIGLQLYDHGATIPVTLPKQTHYPRILKFMDPEATPAGLIAAAMEYGRTSTGQPGRGKGLAEMADWIERTGTGFLRILSGAGQVTYRPGGSVEKRNYDVPFRGTLVEWEVTIDE